VLAGDEERRRVERNLHDGVQQRLVGVGIELETVGERSGDPATRERLRAIGRSVDEALDELREVSHGLYPPALGDFGLVAALQSSARRSSAPVAVRADSVGRHPAELEAAVFYTILEAVQNSTKHGGPGVQIDVALREDERALSFDVTDDGAGFDPAATRGGAGMQNMRDRVGALDGRLTIASSPGEGTVVSGSVPLADGPSAGRPGGSTPP
jgi:signal transduction histidine kinase